LPGSSAEQVQVALDVRRSECDPVDDHIKLPATQRLRHGWRIVDVRLDRLRAGQPVRSTLSAPEQRELDAASQRQPGACAADDPCPADEEYVHAPDILMEMENGSPRPPFTSDAALAARSCHRRCAVP
jgi:hypothetical protein